MKLSCKSRSISLDISETSDLLYKTDVMTKKLDYGIKKLSLIKIYLRTKY